MEHTPTVRTHNVGFGQVGEISFGLDGFAGLAFAWLALSWVGFGPGWLWIGFALLSWYFAGLALGWICFSGVGFLLAWLWLHELAWAGPALCSIGFLLSLLLLSWLIAGSLAFY